MGGVDEDSFVVYGEPFSDAEDDTKRFNDLLSGRRTNRPQSYEQAVLNERGRPLRFHGAFTGGFSAGYFNTVGSKEGFKPRSFHSSRKNRDRLTDESNIQRPEDFMDDEDFGEFGIAPRRIKTTFEYDDSHLSDALKLSLGDQSVIPGASSLLKKLIVPQRGPLAERLLRHLGWKTYSVQSLDDDNTTNETSDVRNEDGSGAGTFAHIHFQPKTNTFGLGYSGLDPNLAMGRSGSGFSNDRRHPGESLSALLHHQQSVKHSSEFDPKMGIRRRGITGQAFGVGILQNEDADVYAQDNLNDYDWAIAAEEQEEDEDEEQAEIEAARIGRLSSVRSNKPKSQSKGRIIDGWTAPAAKSVSSKDSSQIISGFCQGSNPFNDAPFLSSVINLPPGYVPAFKPSFISNGATNGVDSNISPCSDNVANYAGVLDPLSRARILNDSKSDSLIDTLAPVHQLRLKAAALGLPVPNLNHEASEKPIEKCSPITVGLLKIFQSDGNKQARFEAYQVLVRRGFNHDEAYKRCSTNLDVDACECEAEAKLFASLVSGNAPTPIPESPKRSNMECDTSNHRGLKGAIPLHKQTLIANKLASRFRSAGCMDISKELSESEEKAIRARVESLETVEPRDHAVATESYGALTRRRLKWHPDKLLCKRLNIPDPYPDSTYVGCPDERRPRNLFHAARFNKYSGKNQNNDKEFSIFDLLDVNMGSEESKSVVSRRKNDKSLFSVLFQDEMLQAPKSEGEVPDTGLNELNPLIDCSKTDVQRVTDIPLGDLNDSVNEPVSSDSSHIIGPRRPNENQFTTTSQPSMDLFKSIFASDEELESSESDVDTEAGQQNESTDKVDTTDKVFQNRVETDLFNQLTEPRLLPSMKPSALFAHLFQNDSNIVNRTTEQEITAKNQVLQPLVTDSLYGPDLPPNYDGSKVTDTMSTYTPVCLINNNEESVEFVESSKYHHKQHKHRTKKKQHKKH